MAEARGHLPCRQFRLFTHSHSCQRTFACTIFRPPPSAVLEETDRRGLGGGRGSQQRKQQSARALAATPKRAGGIGSSSRRALRTTAAAVPVDSHGMPMFSADPFEGREPPKKVVLAYSGGLDTSVILVRAPPLASCRGQTDGPAQSDRNVPAAPFGLTHAIVQIDVLKDRAGPTGRGAEWYTTAFSLEHSCEAHICCPTCRLDAPGVCRARSQAHSRLRVRATVSPCTGAAAHTGVAEGSVRVRGGDLHCGPGAGRGAGARTPQG